MAGFTAGSGDDKWLATWTGAGIGIVIGLVVLALLPIIPFTEQYSRESTPQQYWSSPTFKRINLVLSAAWGVAIVALLPIAIIIYLLKFSKSYPDRCHPPRE